MAEDDKYFRNSVTEELRNFNIETIGVAATGLELIDLLQTKTPDVILLDLRMPVMDGDKAFDRIMADHPDAKVIIISLYDEMCLIEDYLFRGAYGFISKAVMTMELLNEAIRTAYHSQRFFYSYDPKEQFFNGKELLIIPLLCEGKKTIEISKQIGLSVKTVEAYRTVLYRKTKSRNLAEFVKNATVLGLDMLKKKDKS